MSTLGLPVDGVSDVYGRAVGSGVEYDDCTVTLVLIEGCQSHTHSLEPECLELLCGDIGSEFSAPLHQLPSPDCIQLIIKSGRVHRC